jgi:hypothetical protein
VDHIIGADSRAVAVQWLAGFVTAETEIKIRKFMLLDGKCPGSFHKYTSQNESSEKPECHKRMRFRNVSKIISCFAGYCKPL